MTTIAQVIGGLQRDPSVVAGRALAAAFATQRQQTPFVRVPRRAARRCWDGVVVTAAVPMDTFIGELPAAWLAPRGIALEVIRLDDRVDLERFRALPLGLRWLLDVGALMDLPPIGAAVQAAGGRLFANLADDLGSTHPAWPGWLAALQAQSQPELERRLAACDGIVINAPALRAVAARYNRNIIEIPVAPPPLRDFAPRPVRPGRARRVGYAGTWAHVSDLDLIREPVVDWLTHEAGGVFAIAGQAFPAWVDTHPGIECYPGALRLAGYYRQLAALDLDLFCVPLADTAFNRGKTPLKAIEAAALGLPCIVSDVAPYRGVLSEVTGHLLVENTAAAWSAALDRLTSNDMLRLQLATAGRAWAATKTIEAVGPLWEKFWTGH